MIYIKVCVLRDDGGMLSVALNAAAIALLDSGNYFILFTSSILFYFFLHILLFILSINFSDANFTFYHTD